MSTGQQVPWMLTAASPGYSCSQFQWEARIFALLCQGPHVGLEATSFLA